MADIDFSSAILDVASNAKVLTYVPYLGLYDGSIFLATSESSGFDLLSWPTVNVISNSPTKVSISFAGTISNSTARNSFFIWSSNSGALFEVTNISFNNGDTFSFIIDIETSGNT